MNAKMGKDLYRMVLPNKLESAMVIGVFVVNQGRKSIIGLSSSYSKNLS
jgi:hypothetical protein